MTNPRFRVLALLYFASGAAALVDEVTFFKYLSLVFGATAHASSAVLVAFMGGLALGAFAAAAFEKSALRPLVAYGMLEIAVGAACFVAPALFGLVTRAYVASAASLTGSPATLALLRYAMATAVVILPAIGMGATLPLVARVLGDAGDGARREGTASRRIAVLYAINTAGGAAGSLASAYVIIPALGLSGTMRASGLVSVAVGIAGAWMGRSTRISTTTTTTTTTTESATAAAPTESATSIPTLYVVAVASGLLVFASEVIFVHLLALIVGTSVYVFGLVLAIFLVALSFGAGLSRPLARRAPQSALAISLAVTALALAAGIPLWESLPSIFVTAGPSVTSWHGREAIRALVSFAALAAPVTAMGMAFPLVLQAAATRLDASRIVGRATGVNTLASIAGSLVGGWLLVPYLGSQKSLVVVAIGYAVAAVVVMPRSPRASASRASRFTSSALPALTAAVAVVLALVAPRWNLTRIAGGTNVYFEKQLDDKTRVVWVHEDVHGGVTTVTRGDVTTLYTNGKFQGDDGFQMTAQFGFAHIPTMFVSRFDRALVIGLGTGTTVGQLAAYPFERIDVAELSPGIAFAARTFFGKINRDVLGDPRVTLRFEDGRNVLLVGKEPYDLVSIEISSIWFAGAANLYNRELYVIASARMQDDGVLQQWMQLHHTTRRELASQLATVRDVFPHVILFVRGEQGIVVASRKPLVAVRERLERLDAMPRLRAELGPTMHLADYLADAVLADETLDRFVDEVARESKITRDELVSTDDNAMLEYATPKNNVPGLPETDETGAMLRAYRPLDIAARHSAP